MRVPQPYLINPVEPKGEAQGRTAKVRRANMAKKKRRKLAGAALAAHQAKVAKKSRKSSKRRKSAPKASAPAPSRKRRSSKRKSGGTRSLARAKSQRRRHPVKAHKRRGGRVHSYARHGAFVRKHMSNPSIGAVTMEGLMAAGIILGSVLVVGYANGQLGRWSKTSSGWGNLAGKLAIALGAGLGAHYAARKGYLSKASAYAVTGAAFAPLVLAGVASFAPAIAGRVTLANEDTDAPQGMAGGNGLQAQLEAELQAELNDHMERDETEASLV
jgi:hypothetical protein